MLSGGLLVVPNIILSHGGLFTHSGGILAQSGTLSAIAGNIYAGSGTQFGALQLSSTPPTPCCPVTPGYTNSSLHMPTNSAVVRFHNSSGLAWASDATLTISNWNGSYLGGGSHRIIFGNSASALTAQQLRQIFFRDPGGGLSPGLHPTKILPSGEIVPDSVPPTGRIPPRLALRKQPDGTKQITVTGEAGYDYGILRSFYLNDWEFWTNRVATNGTMSVIDSDTWPSKRFYKAVLMR